MWNHPFLRTVFDRFARCVSFAALVCGLAAPEARAQVELCEDAELFVAAEIGMAAVTEADDVDDWRTDTIAAGCRVTAAGLTRRTFGGEAERFFERLREAAWTRTPDPRDAPNESSLRFRKSGVDCLFSFYSGGLLGTDAELEVDDQRVPGPGERRFNFLVQCMHALPAAPRDTVARAVKRDGSSGPIMPGSP